MTLEEIFEKYKGGIRIPRIQRGYVQGRDDEKGKEILANFVPTLVDAVFNGKDLSLDFIYGVERSDDVGGRCLLPLDGQQRLTTLFLLACLCGKWNREWHFAYESRRIPQLFVEGLMGHLYMATDKPSAEIENADWFLPVWRNDPTVAGMLRMLDALYDAIKIQDCTKTDFGRITFLLHGIDGNAETFDHIFRKMNARGKELSPWENLKAMLDKYLPDSLADEWRDKIDDEWAEAIWKHAGGDIAKLDKAMEKIVRIAYSRFAWPDSYDDPLYVFESKLSERQSTDGVSVFDRKLFYQTACLYFSRIKAISHGWSKDRRKNVLWGESSDGADFWKWLLSDSYCSFADRLRYAFLSELSALSDHTRRRRIVLNLLDNTIPVKKEDLKAMLAAGLEFLSGKLDLDGLDAKNVGYSSTQVADEKRKWNLDADRVVEFEKDDIIHCGSLQFIGWSDFKDEDDVKSRLEKIKVSIDEDWIGFFCKILVRLDRGDKDELKYRVSIPYNDYRRWGECVLSSNQVTKAIAGMEAGTPAPKSTCWLRHFEELARGNQLGNNYGLRAFDGWTYVVADVSRSPYSIRLDYNEIERENRQKLADEIIRYEREGIRWTPRPAKLPGVGYDVWDESWYTTTNPHAVPMITNGTK